MGGSVQSNFGKFRTFDVRPYVRLWLLADIHPHSDLRPLYPRKQTLVALQSFGLKKRTSEVGSTRESGHKWLGRGMSAFDPKRTFIGLGCLAGGY